MKGKSLRRVQLFATPWTSAYQAPLSMQFSRQEYWSGVPLPSPGKPIGWVINGSSYGHCFDADNTAAALYALVLNVKVKVLWLKEQNTICRTYSNWASLVAQLVQNLPVMKEIWVRSWVGKIPWERERLPTPVFWPREFYGRYSSWDFKESDKTVQHSALSSNIN